MGFRSSFITEFLPGIEVPNWFVEKYPNHYIYSNTENKKSFPIIQPWESKFYGLFDETEIFNDIQRILMEKNDDMMIILILLHECGGITRVEITKDSIKGSEPTDWKEVDRVKHNYCYSCSDIKYLTSKESPCN